MYFQINLLFGTSVIGHVAVIFLVEVDRPRSRTLLLQSEINHDQ